jgi:hypothetical protein
LPRPGHTAAEAAVEGPSGATGVCPESTVVKSGSAMPSVGVHHPEVEAFPRRAPRGSSPTFMGSFNVKVKIAPSDRQDGKASQPAPVTDA